MGASRHNVNIGAKLCNRHRVTERLQGWVITDHFGVGHSFAYFVVVKMRNIKRCAIQQ